MDSIERARKREYNRTYRESHRDELNARQRQWYAEHKEYHKAWRAKNREKYNAYQLRYAIINSKKASVSWGK